MSVGYHQVSAGIIDTRHIKKASVEQANINLPTLVFGNYSTQERNTGFTWVNGMQIYKKTISVGALPNNTTKNVPHGITGLAALVAYEGYSYSPSNDIWQMIPSVNTALEYLIGVRVESNVVRLQTSRDMQEYTTGYVTLYYTKS